MSGICGWVGVADPAVLDAMLEAISYRGDTTDREITAQAAIGYRWWADRPGKSPGVHRTGGSIVACAGTFAPPVASPAAELSILLAGGSGAEAALFGIVPRPPLFDRAVVELAVSLPPQLRLRGSVEKWILKQAVRDLLPPTIIERPKSGMLVPVEAWFRGPLLPAARERLLDGLRPYGLFRRGYLEQLLSGKLGGVRPRIGAKIWLLVTLEAWLRTVLARRLP